MHPPETFYGKVRCPNCEEYFVVVARGTPDPRVTVGDELCTQITAHFVEDHPDEKLGLTETAP